MGKYFDNNLIQFGPLNCRIEFLTQRKVVVVFFFKGTCFLELSEEGEGGKQRRKRRRRKEVRLLRFQKLELKYQESNLEDLINIGVHTLVHRLEKTQEMIENKFSTLQEVVYEAGRKRIGEK